MPSMTSQSYWATNQWRFFEPQKFASTNKSAFTKYTMTKTSYIQWNDDEVHFVLFYRPTCASSLTQQSIYVALLGHIIMIPRQAVVTLIP